MYDEALNNAIQPLREVRGPEDLVRLARTIIATDPTGTATEDGAVVSIYLDADANMVAALAFGCPVDATPHEFLTAFLMELDTMSSLRMKDPNLIRTGMIYVVLGDRPHPHLDLLTTRIPLDCIDVIQVRDGRIWSLKTDLCPNGGIPL